MGNDLISIDTGDFVLFQSTFPRGERPSSSTRIPFLSQFQSTFPRGERHKFLCSSGEIRNFNPRSRVGNDLTPCVRSSFSVDFNPRSRVGNDHIRMHFFANIRISIHVPAWGTTQNSEASASYILISIHVPAWGTTAFAVSSIAAHPFQSTFPRGERHYINQLSLWNLDFNPRSRVGNDAIFATESNFCDISIHVPAWGTTDVPLSSGETMCISIHVPAWGTTERRCKYDSF